MKKIIIIVTIIIVTLFIFCGCEPAILRREITAIPNKTTYAQYYDKELDFAGGEITYYYDNGASTTYEMAGDVTLMDDVYFNEPGEYRVYLNFRGNATEFKIKVVPIEEADWLPDMTRNAIQKRYNKDTVDDETTIRNISDKFLSEILELNSKMTPSALDEAIEEIRPLLDERFNDKFREKIIEEYQEYFDYEFPPSVMLAIDNKFKYIYVEGDKAEVGVLEYGIFDRNNDAGQYMIRVMHTFTFIEKEGRWYISNDVLSEPNDLVYLN